MWKNESPHTLHSKISYSDSYTSLQKTLTCILWVNFLACELYLKKSGIKTNKGGIKKSRKTTLELTLLITDCPTFITTERQFLHQNKDIAHLSAHISEHWHTDYQILLLQWINPNFKNNLFYVHGSLQKFSKQLMWHNLHFYKKVTWDLHNS